MDEEKQIEETIHTIKDVNTIYVQEVDKDGDYDIGYSDRYAVNKTVAEALYVAGYRKADEVIDEFIERLKEENKISFRRYGKSIGMTDIFRIADEMKFKLFKQREKNNG